MRFDCHGRFVLDVERLPSGEWCVLQVGDEGKRRLRDDVVIPPHVREDDLVTWLDDLLHEHGGPGRAIRRVD